MNGTKEEPEPETVPQVAGDYFIVSGDSGTWLVSTVMARHIESVLDARPRPRWVRFVDLAGSRVRLRTRGIHYICQSTAEQRAMDRRFSRALVRERKADHSWEDDE